MRISVEGIEPAPQGSKKHVGHGRMIEVSKRVKPWRKAVRLEALAQRAPLIEGACDIAVVFRFSRPKAHLNKRGKLKPQAPTFVTVKRNDIDKLLRSTLDALTGSAILDDSQVVTVAAEKRYCLEGEPAGAEIIIKSLE